jgi:hypothetical protein
LADGVPETDARVVALREQIDGLKTRIAALPFIDTFDLRYQSFTKQPEPTSKAVMLCIMDVSGSMDQVRKNLAKRFFILLYLFLQRNYDKIDVVFIRHHTIAQEVDEQEFFYSRETGGTVVSSALNLAYEVVSERYDSDTGTSMRAGFRRRQLGLGLRHLPRLAHQQADAADALLRLRRDHAAPAPEPLVRLSGREGGAPALRDGRDRRCR